MRRLLFVCLLICLLSTLAMAQAPRNIMVLITYSGVSLNQLIALDNPDLNALLRHGAIGLMNNKTDGQQNFTDNAVTISAGTHAVGGDVPSLPLLHEHIWGGFNAMEDIAGTPAVTILARNIGVRAPKDAVVHTGIGHIIQLNSAQKYEIRPGLLGEQLGKSHVSVSVYGNSDQGGVLSRNAVAIAMNCQGWVPHGDVSTDTLVTMPDHPYGVQTDYEQLFKRVASLPAGNHFIVLEMGDGERVEAARDSLLPERYRKFKDEALRNSLRCARQIDSYLRSSTDRYLLAFVIVEQNSDDASRGDLLTPVVLTGNGISAGLLQSETTRRAGVLTNIDLAPTVLQFFNITPHISMLGEPLKSVATTHPLSRLRADNEQMVATYHARLPVLVGYVMFVALGGVLAIVGTILWSQTNGDQHGTFKLSYIRPLLIALLLVPLFMTIASGLGIHAETPSAIFLLCGTLGVGTLLHCWTRDSRLVAAVVGCSTAAVLSIDLILGAPLLKHSILSYDPITGIRFYGLGNEASGVLIGSSLLGIYALLDYFVSLRRRILLFILVPYLIVFIVIGSPTFGSDFGGMFAAIAGFGFALLKARDDKAWRRLMIWFACGAGALLITMIAVNVMMAPSGQTHIGRAFNEALQQGPSVLVDLAVRKWSMNIRLIKSSIWTYALVSLLFSLVILFYRPVGIVQEMLRKHTLMNAGFMGILVGMIVAMLTNDSGVAMAATGLLFLAVPLMLLVITEVLSVQQVNPVEQNESHPIEEQA